ncbi:P-loop containing nucleoside triphosphate hydrolase protein [Lipomyces tetrasporus]|uniref:P-loop containing nucleoside triphosphate hydrolase protein n=1 Tax=Lipomyces tetrasporus TaxID=54092 RepID=A0AAD7QW75_9ASCO|nr:P-loop containing nucleoside triphosphate hydrolase protein [Lipomyces tetrasporus]KAJ8102583.1 P-loop containing nucleoside triphosphate hydrolase protein [Lipomyces tetrasporus]
MSAKKNGHQDISLLNSDRMHNKVTISPSPASMEAPARDFVVLLHNQKEPRGQRYLKAETIARILHEFRNGWLEAELINGYRIVISPDRLDRYTNGMQAFERFLTSIAEAPTQYLAVRSRKKHKPISGDNRDIDDLDKTAPEGQITEADEAEMIFGKNGYNRFREDEDNDAGSEQSEGAAEAVEDAVARRESEGALSAKDEPLYPSFNRASAKTKRFTKPISESGLKKRRAGGRSRRDFSGDELNYSSENMPLGRMSALRNRPKPSYSELPLFHESSDDEPGDSESSTSNRNLLSLKSARPSAVEQSERNLKRRRAPSNDSLRSIHSMQSDHSADTSDRRSASQSKRVKISKMRSELRPGRLQPLSTAKNKKRFLPEDFDSEYSRRHIHYCDACKLDSTHIFDKGQLIHCQGCSFSYHVLCCKQPASKHVLTLVTEHLFVLQCRYCIGAETTDFGSQLCFVCGQEGLNCKKFVPFVPRLTAASSATTPSATETDENEKLEEEEITDPRMFNPERVMFRCSSCRRCAHYDHLPAIGLDESQDDEDVVSQYSEFQCPMCAAHPAKVENILAWRPLEKGLEDPSQEVSLTTVLGYKREYLVKFERQSYFHVTWVPGSWLFSTASSAQLRSFHKKHPFATYSVADAVPEDNYRIESILDVVYKGDKTRTDMKFTSKDEELNSIGEVQEVFAKWKGLSFSELFWEEPPSQSHKERYADFQEAYEDYVRGFYIHLPQSAPTDIRKFKQSAFAKHELKEQPKFIVGGTLMDYQLEGMNWLYFKWFQNKPAILADDMGLGKTIQIISYLSILFHVHGIWPVLVVAPQSTVPNWKREFRKWAPDIRCIAYNGWKEHRQIQQKYQMCVTNKKGVNDLNCHVVITSFNALMDDSSFLNRYTWQVLVVDEGQRLKSDKNMTYKSLKEMHTGHKVLLTGTPLQNNIRELFNLLQFLNPAEVDAEKLEGKYSEMSESNVVELHNLLRPYFLRRTKAEVLSHLLPQKTEIIVPVSMVTLQKRLYKSILAKNPDLLRAIVSKTNLSAKASTSNLNNIFMQLRKCLCHPYLCNQDIEQLSTDPTESLKRLTEACGKLQLLSIMLPKLIAGGHRILIFSQFVIMLDILEDFLYGMGISYARLDGSVTSQDRQQRIDAFNAEGSKISVFILSTRAGGVGINLATADTVIVYDPDFNPHQDMQALSRAHRIGQKKKVLVFNLVTRNSVEEKILEIGRKKMLLDHIVIENMGNVEEENFDLQGILRNGARLLFENNEEDIKYDSAAVDKLLARTAEEEVVSASQQREENRFGFARVWESETADLAEVNDLSETDEKKPEGDDTGFWDKVLQEREAEIRDERAARQAQFGRGKRIREAITKNHVDRAESNDDTDQQTSRPRANSSDSEASFHLSPTRVSVESEDEFQDADMDEIDLLMNLPTPSTTVPKEPTSAAILPNLATGTPPTATLPFDVRQLETEVSSPALTLSQPTTVRMVPVSASEPLVVPRNLAASRLVPPSPGPEGFVGASTPITVLQQAAATAQRESEVAAPMASAYMTLPSEPAVQSLADQMSKPGPGILIPASSTSVSQESPLVFQGGTAKLSRKNSSDVSQSVQFVTNTRMPYNPRYPFVCDGSHSTHEPGKCPLRATPVEYCPLCGYAHLAGVQICPQFLSVDQLGFLIAAVKESKEPDFFKVPALKYLTVVLEKLMSSITGRSNVH